MNSQNKHRQSKRVVRALIALAAWLAANAAFAQTPWLSIRPTPSNYVEVAWTAPTASTNALQAAQEINPFAHWWPLTQAASASNETLAVCLPVDTAAKAFFRTRAVIEGDLGLPFATLLQPTNGATLSGLCQVRAGASDDRQISMVNLYVDGQIYATRTEGNLLFNIETSHFPNGQHELMVVAFDNVGISYLGGDPDSEIPAHSATSAVVTVTFNNPVRWQNPVLTFDRTLPITVVSDYYPTNYTLTLVDESGTAVWEYSGYTEDGIISYGFYADATNVTVPRGAAYQVLVTLGGLESLNAGQMSALAEDLSLSALKTTGKKNRYGVLEYELAAATEQASLEEKIEIATPIMEVAGAKETIALPPLPPSMDWKQNRKLAKKPKSAGQILFSLPQPDPDPAAPPPPPAAATTLVVWREPETPSRKMLLSRQHYSAYMWQVFNAGLGAALNAIADLIEDADLPNRGLYEINAARHFVCDQPADYTTLLNTLPASDLTHFYYHGHNNGQAIGFSEGSPNAGIRAQTVATVLGNYFRPFGTNNPRVVFQTLKPYRFVFLDGCLSAAGIWPEAFGIPKQWPRNINWTPAWLTGNAPPGLTIEPNRPRAFLGWTAKTKNTLLNNDFQLWSKKLLQFWIGGESGEDFSVRLGQAIDEANQIYPGVLNTAVPVVYGTQNLTYEE